MTISDEFKKVLGNEKPDISLFVPILRWFSGHEHNIEFIQKINMRFSITNTNILLTQLALNNKLKHFIAYPPPKAKKENKEEFFIRDVCKRFGWSLREFEKNKDVLDLEDMKEELSISFAYNDMERKAIKLKKRKW